jgi:GTP-binding protein
MSFIDIAKLRVKAGKGGDGIVAFRREAHVPLGGPFGGDGGKGGSIIFEVDTNKTTLLDFKYTRLLTAESGGNGKSKKMRGADGKDKVVAVPLGTIVRNLETGTIIADLTNVGQRAVICKGGLGGRGNFSFKSSRNPAPDFAERGEEGEEFDIEVELKLLADVGLVGFPSVGKSTILSVVSSAKPEIADYPFTTLTPKLGVVNVGDGRSFVMADLPGLIEGASAGAGLGIQFLRHIERTRVILHLVDISASEGRNPYQDYLTINKELENYNPKLLQRPQIIVANKMDLPESEKNLEEFKKQVKDVLIIPISAYTKKNLDQLLYKTADLLDQVAIEDFEEPITEEVVEYKFTPSPEPFTITRADDGVYVVNGPMIERYFNKTNFENEESVKIFSQRLRKLGVDDALRKLGVKNGDSVRIIKYEFEFFD